MKLRTFLMIGLVALLSGCAAADDGSDEEVADDDDDGNAEVSEDAVSVAGRWKIPANVKAAGAAANFAYDGAPNFSPSRCAGGMKPGSLRLKSKLNSMFDPQILRIEGYNCRRNTASSSKMSIHGTGRALDIFIPMSGGAADNTKGDAVANYIVQNAKTLGVQLVIWDRTSWQVGKGEKAYGGPHPHNDHVHIELTEEASR